MKRDRMNMSLLNAAHADDRDKRSAGGRIYALLNDNNKRRNGPPLKQRQDEATRSELKTTKSLGEDLIRDHLREEDRAGDLNKPMGSLNLCDRHNARIQAGPGGLTREEVLVTGRHEADCFYTERLQKAKHEK